MNKPSRHIQQFFKEYEEGANTFELALNVRERANTWLAADPNGVAVVRNDDQFPAVLRQRYLQLKELGYAGAVITSLTEEVLDAHYSLVKTGWRQTYHKDGADIPIDITVDYLVRIEPDRTAAIIASIAHEDEAELLKAASIA